jgi:hypothetical protein
LVALGGVARALLFFGGRRPIVVDFDDYDAGSFLAYPNLSPKIGAVLSRDLRLIEPLSTTLGLEDLEDMLEVIKIDAHNARVIAKERKPK